MVTPLSEIENSATKNLRDSKVRISATQLKPAESGGESPLRGALLWTLIATSFAFVVVQLDVTIVNVALPQIGASLHSGVTGLQWVVDAYTLSFAVLLIAAGSSG